jgi:predicted AAA+ superfamily ATPase
MVSFMIPLLVHNGITRLLIQVASDPTAFGVKERETSALVAALVEFRLKHGLVITSDHSGEERVEGRTIHYVPFWKWVLAEDPLTPA